MGNFQKIVTQLLIEPNRGPPILGHPLFATTRRQLFVFFNPRLQFESILVFSFHLTHEAKHHPYLSPMTMPLARSRTGGARRAGKTTTSDGGFIATLSRFWQVCLYLSFS